MSGGECWKKCVDLNVVSKSLVELSNLVRDREVDSAITDLNNETSKNIRVDLVGYLEGLSFADKRRLGNSSLETADGLIVESRSRGDGGLNDTLGSIGQDLKLVDNRGDKRESVVLGKESKEVSNSFVGVDSRGESADDGLFILSRQGRVGQNGRDLDITLDNFP